MKKNAILIFTFVIVFPFFAKPCANNFYSINRDGKLTSIGSEWRNPFHLNFDKYGLINNSRLLITQLNTKHYYTYLSDYAVCLMKLGKPELALSIFKKIYEHYPRDYRITSNLGTCYELIGQLDSAMVFIKKTIELNPGDHYGSEWIHVKILETKKRMQTDSNYLKNNAPIDLSETELSYPKLSEHLSIQLHERIPFTKGPNLLIGNLLILLGDLTSKVESIEFAKGEYQIAKKVYGVNPDLVNAKIEELNLLLKKYAFVKPPYDTSKFPLPNIRIEETFYWDFVFDDDPTNVKVNWGIFDLNLESLFKKTDFTISFESIKKMETNDSINQKDLYLIDNKDTFKGNSVNGKLIKDLIGQSQSSDNNFMRNFLKNFIIYLFVFIIFIAIVIIVFRKKITPKK